jgi:hypothetical protein
MQSRTRSLIEQVLNTGTGFLISLLVWEFVVKPVWDIHTNFAENLSITLLFTAVSIARSYAWRRIFNHLDTNNYKKVQHGNTDRDHRAGALR